MSALSFLHFAALGLAAPYINLYLKSIGFSGTQIGLLISLGAFLEISVVPVTNWLADRHSRHRSLYYLQTSLITLATLLLAITTAPVLLTTSFIMNTVSARAANESLSQLTLTRLDELKRNIFGKIRLWGSVGWAVTTLTSGAIIAIGSYPLAFFSSALVRLTMFPLIGTLPRQTNQAGSENQPAPRRTALYILMMSQFLFYVGLSAVYSFLWIHLRENLGVPAEQIGMFAAIFAICELLPMLFVDRLIDRLGIRRVMIGGIVGMAFIWVLYGLLPSIHWLIPLQMLRGVFFTMFIIGITMIIDHVSLPANVATNRALVTVTMPALAMLVSGPLVGWLYDYPGAQIMFTFAMVMGISSGVFLLFNYDRLRGPQKSA